LLRSERRVRYGKSTCLAGAVRLKIYFNIPGIDGNMSASSRYSVRFGRNKKKPFTFQPKRQMNTRA
jgi:hypothetical protein